ncbi:MAG TPA: MarC family protein [Gemmatimonadaceae bacterium]|jgi:MarC family membrane protein|nr:MarC family protein [Gemmatimonadaceae bacterium]HEU6452873.1 MarC family protein [Gemmatimonadaceae bacterium]
MTLLSAAVLLFFVMDPLGNVPLFLTALRHVDPSRMRGIIVRELLIALGIMVAFLFLGRYILELLHVSSAALTAGGGFILLLIALRMIFPTSERSLREEIREEPFIVPLAVPYTAGPGLLATELLFMTREPHRWPIWLGAVALAWLATAIILYFSSHLRTILGERGLTAVERLMGMLLVVVGVEMLMAGVVQYLKV